MKFLSIEIVNVKGEDEKEAADPFGDLVNNAKRGIQNFFNRPREIMEK